MAALVTAAQVREHVETDLSDDALGRLINAADAEIVGRYGDHTADAEELFTPTLGELYLYTERSISTVTSIVEKEIGPYGEVAITIATNDYEISGGSAGDVDRRQLRRLVTGTNARSGWAPMVIVTYAPQSDNARRIGVTIDLVRLSAGYTGNQSESIGNMTVQHSEYRREWELNLRKLGSRGLGIA